MVGESVILGWKDLGTRHGKIYDLRMKRSGTLDGWSSLPEWKGLGFLGEICKISRLMGSGLSVG